MSENRLLVIDDEPAICETIEMIAEETGYIVATTTKGTEFKRLYMEFKPTLIFLDIIMPKPDGIELLRYLGEQNCRAPIAVISGYHGSYLNNASLLGEAMGLECMIVLSKPIGLDEIRSVLEQYRVDPTPVRATA